MPRVVLEPMFPVFERAKKIHSLDLETIVIGRILYIPGIKEFVYLRSASDECKHLAQNLGTQK
jgi:hypothetical protein